jgi:transcriptional regulator with XRE-family HTH domain
VRLAQRRKAAGHSQESLAAQLGVDRSTVVRWEAADTAPQPWLRPKLAEALGITVSDLVGLLDEVIALTETSIYASSGISWSRRTTCWVRDTR